MWLTVLGAVDVVLFVGVLHFFVRSPHGQLLDTVALTGNSIGQTHIQGLVDTILNTISVASLVLATAFVGFIALVRRRVAAAVGAVLLIVGANLTAQLLKFLIVRPDLGIDPERAAAGNSLPSGHTTIAASVAVALLLVVPAAVRGVWAVVGAVLSAAAGVATLSAGWHRPSDAIAALLIVGAWACAAGLYMVVAQRTHGDVEYGPGNRYVTVLLAVAGFALLAGAWIAVTLTDQVLTTPPDEVSRHRLLAAYVGGAMGIAGAASLVMASVLATAHRVVPAAVPVAREPVRV